MAVLRLSRHPQNISLALRIHVIAWFDVGQLFHRIAPQRRVPHLPQRVVLRPQPPQCVRLQAQRPRRPHLIQHRHRIQKPHLVPLMFILIVIREVRIQRIVIQFDL